MENNNTDWMAVQTQVGNEATFADIYDLGVDPSSVTLDTKDTYKNKRKIKENPAFQTNGKFDDKKFDLYYDASVKTLNAYKSSDFSIGTGNIPNLNLWEDTGLAKALGQKTHRDPISIKTNKDPQNNLRNAQKSNLGFIDLNQWSDPQKSLAEVAQGQKVIDGITGKELNFTPEDVGISNAFGFFSEPLVLAAYDQDVKDAEGNVIHRKGETKFDAKGLPRYETLAGRNASGKQILSRWDTLTKEDSYVNKFDFMDSDDINKSLGGSIMKTAVTLLPLALGGPVATAARAYFIADGLLQAGTEISKALMGISGGKDADKNEFYKSLNNVQAYTKQWKGGTSENARNNFFAAENILNLASDSVYQLMGQQAIAMWPQRIRQYQMAKELNLNPSLAQSLTKAGDEALSGVFNFEAYVAKYGDDIGRATAAMSRNVNQLQNMAKYSSYMATGFMSATSAVGISDVADQAGLDARDKGFLYLGLMAGYAPLFRSNIGRFVERGFEIDKVGQGMTAAIRQYGRQYIAPIANRLESEAAEEAAKKAAKESLTGLAKLNSRALDLMIAGKKIGQRVAAKFENITHPMVAALAEGTEEVTEEIIQDALKGVYNSLSQFGLTSTDKGKIEFDMTDMMTRYGQAFVGGAVGGMIFKFVDPDIKIKPFLSEDMKEYVANGYGNDLINRITTMAAAGQLGSTQLSINKQLNSNGVLENDVWAPVNADNPVSQNDFVADRMIKEIRANMSQMEVFGLDNPNSFVEGKNKFYDAIVDTRTDTDLRDRIRSTSDKMVALSNEIKSIEDNDVNAPIIKKKKEEFKELQEDFEYLTTDESVDEYFRQGLFNINTQINSNLGVKNKQTFTEELIGLKANYATLNENDKAKVDAAFDNYRMSNDDTFGIRVDLRNARLQMENFDKEMTENGGFDAVEKYNESIKTLNEYVEQGYAVIDGKTSTNTLIELADDFYDKIKDVQYIPDFMHEEITKRIDEVKTSGLERSIEKVSADNQIVFSVEDFRKNMLNGGIDKLNDTTPLGRLFKAYLSKYKPITVFDEPSYAVLKTDKNKASTSAMIKALASVSSIEDDSPEKQLYIQRQELINALQPEQVRALLIKAPELLQANQEAQDFFSRNYPDIVNSELTIDPNTVDELLNLLSEADYESMLDDESYLDDNASAIRLLSNINMQNFLATSTGESQSKSFGYLAGTNPNILMTQALVGAVDAGSTLKVGNLADVDAKVDEVTSKMEAALKEKATSPLASFLANTYQFKNVEFETIRKLGASNYLNNSDDYDSTLDEHIKQVKRVDAYMRALTVLNPAINKWREKNADIVPKELRDEVLTEISDIGYSTIYHNVHVLLNELGYLKDLNDYNKNNTLAKLLKEDGKQLAASFRTLQKISTIKEVSAYLPSLELFLNDPTVAEYAGDIDNATEEAKVAALGAAAKHEHNLYLDFQNLNAAEKQQLIDFTFKPINSNAVSYRASIDPTEALNDMHQTIYLAKVYGTSSIEYTKAIAGEPDENGYSKISATKMDPFPNQEAAIRLAYFNRYGDPIVKKSLESAFAFRKLEESPTTFNRGLASGVDIDNTVAIVGDPGVGKTKAIIAGILSFDNGKAEDTVLLGAVNEHVENLTNGVVDAGFENRINAGLSDTVLNFLKDLELTDNQGRLLTFDTSSPEMLEDIINVGPYNNDYDSDQNINLRLKALSDNALVNAKFWENDGKLNTVLSEKLRGVRNIVVDEFTHANPVDLAVLSRIISEYNRSVDNNPDSKINLILAGDNNQLGFTVEGYSRTFADYLQIPTSLPLTTSLRSGWDLVNNVLTEIKDRTSRLKDMSDEQVKEPLVATNLRAVPIRLTYTNENNLPIGIFRKEVSGETLAEHLTFITDNIDAIKTRPNSLVFVVNTQAEIAPAEALMRELLGQDWKGYATVLTPEKTQGREFKYAIIDASPNSAETYKVRAGYKFLNTMLSRATEATLLIDKGAYSGYATFEQIEVPKAIDQKKLTDEMIEGIKANRQAVTVAKLNEAPTTTAPEPIKPEDAENTNDVEEELAENVASEEPIVTPDEGVSEAEKELVNEEPEPNAIQNELLVLDEDDAKALFNSETIDPDDSTDIADDFVRTSPYMVNSYTSFTFKRDTDVVKAIVGNNDLSDLDAENLLTKLKEMVTYGTKEFKPTYFNNELTSKLRSKGYKLRNLAVKVRALNRTPEFMSVGRAKWNNNYVERDGQPLLLIEGIIPNSQPDKAPFVFTLGTFNSLDNIKNYGGDVPSVNQFVNDVKASLAATQSWESPEFTVAEWKAMYTRREFKVNFKESVDNAFSDLKQNYKRGMYITEPLVVISKPSSNNPDQWNKLIGNSVAFATEHQELFGKTPNELYDIYKNQIKNFNNDSYKAMTYEEKQAYIDSLPKIPGTNPALAPKPRLVSMMRLTNPRHNFVEFITNYNGLIAKTRLAKANGQSINLGEEVREFEMSPYVADRLVKGMMVIHRMLTDENSAANIAWFEENIMPKVKGNVLTEIAAYMEFAKQQAKADDDVDLSFGNMRPEDLVNNETDVTALRTVEDLVKELDRYLYSNDKLVRGVYKSNDTNNLNRIKGVELTADVDLRTILPDELTTNKNADFSKNGVLKVRNLSIYNGLKPSFLKMINESLIALGTLPTSHPSLGKYSLNEIFKDGKIENIIVAGVGTNGRQLNNALAPVVQSSLVKGFRTNAESLQPASFYVDFNKMMDKMGSISSEATSATQRLQEEEAAKVEASRALSETLNSYGITNDYDGYEELASRVFSTVDEVQEAFAQEVVVQLKPTTKVTNVKQKLSIDTTQPNKGSIADIIGIPENSSASVSDNGELVIVQVDHEDRVDNHIFDKFNDWKHTVSPVFKNNQKSIQDAAKSFIDSQGLTKEKLDQLTIQFHIDNTDLAKDVSTLKGTELILPDGAVGVVLANSIGPSGDVEDSYITLDVQGNKVVIAQSEIKDPRFLNLPEHNSSLRKATAYNSNPENFDYESTLIDMIGNEVPPEQSGDFISAILSNLGIENNFTEDTSQSAILSINELIDNVGVLIVSPWSSFREEPMEAPALLNAYEKLAKGLYADNLHAINGFVNNFSIFANGEWEQHQAKIDEILSNSEFMAIPGISEAIIKLEKQLNKLTHDC